MSSTKKPDFSSESSCLSDDTCKNSSENFSSDNLSPDNLSPDNLSGDLPSDPACLTNNKAHSFSDPSCFNQENTLNEPYDALNSPHDALNSSHDTVDLGKPHDPFSDDSMEYSSSILDMPDQKKKFVHAIFSNIATNYTKMNDFMSMGLHRLWKKKFIHMILQNHPENVLDMACGTGDIAMGLYKKNPLLSLTCADPNHEMLDQARTHFLNQGFTNNITWVESNAEHTPFENDIFDAYSIAFGLRNTSSIIQSLQEAYRILKPGGYFYCLEFSHIYVPTLKALYQTYSNIFIPFLGEKIARNKQAYTYLIDSIQAFPKQEKLALLMKEAGFKNINFKNLNLGLVAIHYGKK